MQLRKYIKDIEKKEHIKVLFLIESGSRAWNWASDDSDYDVRGVFIQDYLVYGGIKGQIERKIRNLDIVLWDLRKFLALMKKSNPSVWEWLSSDITYLDNPLRKELKSIFIKHFSKYALKKHYSSMAKQNFYKYINGVGDTANLKKYVYVLRSIACIIWIEKYATPPPKKHQRLLHLLPKNIRKFFENIVKRKKESESTKGNRNREAEKFVISYFDRDYEKDSSNFSDFELNKLFKKAVKKWN
ncbi:MAG: nucleotidyltransferase domain-containing protein [Nanoarchaeota archaeon]